jgi:hypothetical protein
MTSEYIKGLENYITLPDSYHVSALDNMYTHSYSASYVNREVSQKSQGGGAFI